MTTQAHLYKQDDELKVAPVGGQQWYEQMRLTLIGQVLELLDIAERHAWQTKDSDERRRTEGAIEHARKVTAPYNYNGTTPPATQTEDGNGTA